MRKYIFLFAILAFLFSCEDENLSENLDYVSSINFEQPFQNNIGILSSNDFSNVDVSEVNSILKNSLDLEKQTTFSKFEIVKAKVQGDEEKYYILRSTSDDGSVSIGMNVEFDSKNQRVVIQHKETCKCTSTNCNIGCEVWTMCGCTSCPNGECKKEHTLEGEANP